MPVILQVTGIKLQLLFAFIVLSTVTLIALLLTLLSKNTRSGKVRQLAEDHQWQYQEFINFSDTIKAANFGILNYSQNAVFRHAISASGDADDSIYRAGFNFFDCRAVEVFGIHNSSIILFNLDLADDYSHLHCSIIPNTPPAATHNPMQSSPANHYNQSRTLNLQKLIEIPPHYQFEKHTLHTNQPPLLASFLDQLPKPTTEKTANSETSALSLNNAYWLNNWLLAHPHLHIEISNGILLAYQPNHLLADDLILPAIDSVAALSNTLRST